MSKDQPAIRMTKAEWRRIYSIIRWVSTRPSEDDELRVIANKMVNQFTDIEFPPTTSTCAWCYGGGCPDCKDPTPPEPEALAESVQNLKQGKAGPVIDLNPGDSDEE